MWDRIRQFLAAPVFEHNEDKTRAAVLLNPLLLSMFGVLVLSAIATVFVFAQKLGSGIAVSVIFMILLAAKILLQRGAVRLSAVFFLIGMWILVNAVFVLSGQKSLIGASNVSLIVIAGLILGRGGAVTVAVGSSLVSLIAVAADMFGVSLPVLFPAPPASTWVMLTVSLMMAVVPLNMALSRLNEALGRSRQYASDLEAQREKLQVLIDGQSNEARRREAYLGATTAVASMAAAVGRELPELLARVTEVVEKQFGLYHAGIYLLDELGEEVVLRAASGDAGPQMVAQGFHVRVGEGIIGNVAQSGQYYVVQDVALDTVFVSHAELSETRSEMALPLRMRGEMMGVLDIQSTLVSAFGDEDITVLQALADQVAVAIGNARLFRQVEQSIEAERRAYGELTREAWQRLLHAQSGRGFLSDTRGIVPVGDLWEPQMKQAALTGQIVSDSEGGAARILALPIKVRDEVIGVVDGRKPDGTAWTPEEVALLETLTEQLGVALESARLYQDTQRRAARERAVGEITNRMRRASSVEGIIQTAMRELSSALGVSYAFTRLGVVDGQQELRDNNQVE